MTTRVESVGGTGFVSGGYCGGQEFGSRVSAAISYRPDIVIVQGGLNDFNKAPGQIMDAARSVLARLRGVPRVALVGPTRVPAVEAQRIETVDQVLAFAAAEAKVIYVSALNWQLPYFDDNVHPTLEGQEMYAVKLREALPFAAGR